MAKWVHADVLDGGLNAIKTVATKMMLIKAYTAADSYATVTGNKLAEVAMASADYTLGTSGSNRTLTTATKSAAATAAAPELSSGTATAGSTTTLTDSAKAWTVNAFANKRLTIVSGTGAGQKATITSNTATALTFPALATAPDATSVYRITEDTSFAFTDGSGKVLWVTDETGEAAVAIGDTITFPALVYTNIQPT